MRVVLNAILSTWLVTQFAVGHELPQASPRDVGVSAERLKSIKDVVQTAVEKRETAGVVVLVARRGRVVFIESFGKMAMDSDSAMVPDAIFRIRSMTKPLTTAAALTLYDEGKLALDDSVSKYLPELG